MSTTSSALGMYKKINEIWSKSANPCRLLSSGSLVLLSPSHEDEGYFECTAVNEAGEERRVIEVILQGVDWTFCTTNGQQRLVSDGQSDVCVFMFWSVPPSIEDDVTAVTAVKLAPVVLPCHVHGRPQPTVLWTKGGAKLSSRGGTYRVLPTGEFDAISKRNKINNYIPDTGPVGLGQSSQFRHKTDNWVPERLNIQWWIFGDCS